MSTRVGCLRPAHHVLPKDPAEEKAVYSAYATIIDPASMMCGPTDTTTLAPSNLGAASILQRIPSRSMNNTRRRKRVTFLEVEVFEIPIILGDNPSAASGGPPMTLDWEMLRRSVYDLDSYEEDRIHERRKSTRELRLSSTRRINFFLECGYERAEIEIAATQSFDYRQQMTLHKMVSSSHRRTQNTSNNNSVKEDTRFLSGDMQYALLDRFAPAPVRREAMSMPQRAPPPGEPEYHQDDPGPLQRVAQRRKKAPRRMSVPHALPSRSSNPPMVPNRFSSDANAVPTPSNHMSNESFTDSVIEMGRPVCIPPTSDSENEMHRPICIPSSSSFESEMQRPICIPPARSDVHSTCPADRPRHARPIRRSSIGRSQPQHDPPRNNMRQQRRMSVPAKSYSDDNLVLPSRLPSLEMQPQQSDTDCQPPRRRQARRMSVPTSFSDDNLVVPSRLPSIDMQSVQQQQQQQQRDPDCQPPRRRQARRMSVPAKSLSVDSLDVPCRLPSLDMPLSQPQRNPACQPPRRRQARRMSVPAKSLSVDSLDVPCRLPSLDMPLSQPQRNPDCPPPRRRQARRMSVPAASFSDDNLVVPSRLPSSLDKQSPQQRDPDCLPPRRRQGRRMSMPTSFSDDNLDVPCRLPSPDIPLSQPQRDPNRLPESGRQQRRLSMPTSSFSDEKLVVPSRLPSVDIPESMCSPDVAPRKGKQPRRLSVPATFSNDSLVMPCRMPSPIKLIKKKKKKKKAALKKQRLGQAAAPTVEGRIKTKKSEKVSECEGEKVKERRRGVLGWGFGLF